MTKIKVVSGLLDIKGGQELVFAKLEGSPTFGPVPEEFHVPFTLSGYISHHYGDDGEELDSFYMIVESAQFPTLEKLTK